MAETFPTIVAHIRAGVYTCAAGGTVLLYDMLLTSGDEIRLIWPSPFSLVKCLYFVTWLILEGPYRRICRGVVLYQTISQEISVIAATWILAIRVLALYPKNKILAIALYFVFISTHVTVFVLGTLIMIKTWGSYAYSVALGTCIANSSRYLKIGYFTPILLEVLLVSLPLFHAYRRSRRLVKKARLPMTPLIRTLYADGFAYFVVVVTMKLWTSIMFAVADPSYWYLSVYLETGLVNTSVSRLVLHLRRVAEIHRNHDHSTIPFSQDVSANININNDGNLDRNFKFHDKSNHSDVHELSDWDHHDHRKPHRNDDPLSSFQGTERIQTHPSGISQVHFSALEHFSEAESAASVR